MKKIVIQGKDKSGILLTPKWIVEYFKRKNINIFVYNQEISIDDRFIYELYDANEVNELDDNTKIYTVLYSRKNIGDVFFDDEITEEMATQIINEYDLFENREEQLLIDIANEINNQNLIKIVEIPDDVEYNVVSSSFGFREYVEEKHRIWG